MDPTQSQYPSMEDNGLQYKLPVVEFAAIDHGLQREVIVWLNQMFGFLYISMNNQFWISVLFQVSFILLLFTL